MLDDPMRIQEMYCIEILSTLAGLVLSGHQTVLPDMFLTFFEAPAWKYKIEFPGRSAFDLRRQLWSIARIQSHTREAGIGFDADIPDTGLRIGKAAGFHVAILIWSAIETKA